ncbi:MAG TPA: C4-type zinc ribbon domain-containing protein [Vicinamibacterales bacterium]|nr:C4-type zinc ribbon domain-containing protein [Vicinamibacterales bacterium]
MSPALTALTALQTLDSAADAARKRIAELPAAEQAIASHLAASKAAGDAIKARIQQNADGRRALEREIAAVDTRLARFDDHKAAVKTNQEYTALLHEISGAKAEKDAIEERLLILMDEADGLAAEMKASDSAFKEEEARSKTALASLAAERQTLEAELARLAKERAGAAAGADARALALYEQLLKGRRGVAMARVEGDLCSVCHVRQRPHVLQQVRRNDSIVQCESCQRILYAVLPAPDASATAGKA